MITMSNRTTIIIAAVVAIAVLAVAAAFILSGDGSEYEKVEDKGQIIGIGTQLVYDVEAVQDGDVKTGEMTMKILGMNPSGALISMEASGSAATSLNSGIILTNDIVSSDTEVKESREWDKIDTNFGKKMMSYTEGIQDGMTVKSWTDQYTGIDYKQIMEMGGSVITIVLKSMDVAWMSSSEEILPSDDLGRTRNYTFTMADTVIGEMTMTVVTNPDKDGVSYSRMMIVADGQVAGLYYIPSDQILEGVESTGLKVEMDTVDGKKFLTEYSAMFEGVEAYAYMDGDKIYSIVIDTGFIRATMDYTGESIDRFWEEEE